MHFDILSLFEDLKVKINKQFSGTCKEVLPKSKARLVMRANTFIPYTLRKEQSALIF